MTTYLYKLVVFLGKEIDRREVYGLPTENVRSLYEETLKLIAEMQ